MGQRDGLPPHPIFVVRTDLGQLKMTRSRLKRKAGLGV